jgi:hypothetical protein
VNFAPHNPIASTIAEDDPGSQSLLDASDGDGIDEEAAIAAARKGKDKQQHHNHDENVGDLGDVHSRERVHLSVEDHPLGPEGSTVMANAYFNLLQQSLAAGTLTEQQKQALISTLNGTPPPMRGLEATPPESFQIATPSIRYQSTPSSDTSTLKSDLAYEKALNLKPRSFNGDSEALNDFLDDLEQLFTDMPITYATAKSQVTKASSLLEDRAKRWYRNAVKEDPYIKNDITSFKRALTDQFENVTAKESKWSKFYTLKQTKSAADFSEQLEDLAGQLDIPPAVILARFRQGLKPELQVALAANPVEVLSYREFKRLAVRVDNAMFANKKAHGQASSR